MDNPTIKVIRGDDTSLSLTFSDSTGTAIDLTGSYVFFTVKEDLANTDDQAKIAVKISSHTSPTQGKTTIALSQDDTDLPEGVYYYDFQLKTVGGRITSTRTGIFEVIRDVTLRTN